MQEKNEIKNHIIKIGVFVVAIVVLGISLSYAYFTANGGGQADITDTNAAIFEVTSTLKDSTVIQNNKMALIDASDIKTKAEKVEFSVTNSNNSTVNANYQIHLTNIILSKNLYSEYFKWELVKKVGTEETLITNWTFENAKRLDTPVDGEGDKAETTVEEMILNTDPILIAKNTTDQLIFRLWLENDPDQSQIDLTEGQFKGILKIEATPVK